ncbi:EAL domain-containing protein [Thiotrichales bacterium 19S3-7]|nr:EAL domain-containing protein [Thiotrichales bacterium 19S3-7]MCF6801226.1 EAL domain-containing protein [Thiotrichales bacterium 19S3-11]
MQHNKAIQQKLMYLYTKEITSILFFSMLVGILILCIYSLTQIRKFGYFSSYSIQTYLFLALSLSCLILNYYKKLSNRLKRYFIVIISFCGWLGSLISYGYMSTGSLYILPFIIYISLLGKPSSLVKYLIMAVFFIVLFYTLQSLGYTGKTYIQSKDLTSLSIMIGEVLIAVAILYATIILSMGHTKAMISLVNHLAKKNKSLKETNRKQRYLLSHDYLTGAHSRSFLINELNLRVKRNNGNFILIMLDIINFKEINDKYGHAIGDHVLKKVCIHFRDFIHSIDKKGIISRFGGDEFCILLSDIDMDQLNAKLVSITSEVTAKLKKDMNINFHSVRFSLIKYPQNADNAKDLLNKLNLTVLYAKENRSNLMVYNDEIQNYHIKQEKLRENCIEILDKNLFSIYFQKQLDLKTNKCIGGEVLMRLNKHDMNPLLMSELCYKHALSEELNKKIVYNTLNHLQTVKPQQKLKVSINLLLPNRMIPLHIQELVRIINNFEIDKQIQFCFEIVETNAMEQDELDKALMLIRNYGLEVAIDDFGVQYSNYKRLQSNHISALKIDRSFITDLDKSNNIEIVRSMITMAKYNNIKAIAEGIETKEELQVLHELNCDIIQGYYYHKPENIKNINFNQLTGLKNSHDNDLTRQLTL